VGDVEELFYATATHLFKATHRVEWELGFEVGAHGGEGKGKGSKWMHFVR
jgi:hypothetical protein